MSKLCVIELNEFSPELLKEAAACYGLKNISYILSLSHQTTKTDDETEHQGLDPWVQWVSVHSGRPSSKHGILRLGMTKTQHDRQIWNELDRHNLTWGAWGVMNAPQANDGDDRNCQFFMPDPWSFDEQAFPPELNEILRLPRYVSKNYMCIDAFKVMANALWLIKFLLRPRHWKITADFAVQCLKAPGLIPSTHGFATLLDYLSSRIFARLVKEKQPDYSVIFINTLAHLQHHFWDEADNVHPEMVFGLKMLDRMIGRIREALDKQDSLLVMNALKQKNVKGKGHIIYRQDQPEKVAAELGVHPVKVEQCMTHDAHLFFEDVGGADIAERRLKDARLDNGINPFYVERIDPTHIFYQIAFEDDVPEDIKIQLHNHQIPFFDLFSKVCERTGAHIPQGDVYYKNIEIAENLYNHEIFDMILAHYNVSRQV